MAVAIIAILAFAIIVFGKKQPGSDSLDDLGGIVDESASAGVQKLARAIATAEGFFSAGSRPQRNNNPGDMTQDLVGSATGSDGDFVVYSNAQDGWNCLYTQINAWMNGSSKYHNSNSSISDLAGLNEETGYTSTDQATWATNVANYLGVSTDTTIGEIVNG